jgi:hypothetical protein
MAADAASLDNQLEFGQFFDDLPAQLGPLPDEDDDIGVFEPDGQLAYAFDGVGVDLGGVGLQFGSAVEFSHCVLIVVEDHNIHADIVPARFFFLAGRVVRGG